MVIQISSDDKLIIHQGNLCLWGHFKESHWKRTCQGTGRLRCKTVNYMDAGIIEKDDNY